MRHFERVSTMLNLQYPGSILSRRRQPRGFRESHCTGLTCEIRHRLTTEGVFSAVTVKFDRIESSEPPWSRLNCNSSWLNDLSMHVTSTDKTESSSSKSIESPFNLPVGISWLLINNSIFSGAGCGKNPIELSFQDQFVGIGAFVLPGIPVGSGFMFSLIDWASPATTDPRRPRAF